MIPLVIVLAVLVVVVGFLAILNGFYILYYQLRREKPVLVSSSMEVMKWWRWQQKIFFIFLEINLVLLSMPIILLAISLFGASFAVVGTSLVSVTVTVAIFITLFVESPYQPLLKATVKHYLIQNGVREDLLNDKGFFVNLLSNEWRLDLDDGTDDVGFMVLDGNLLQFFGLGYQIEIERNWVDSIEYSLWFNTLSIFGTKRTSITYTDPSGEKKQLKFFVRAGVTNFSHRKFNQEFQERLTAFHDRAARREPGTTN